MATWTVESRGAGGTGPLAAARTWPVAAVPTWPVAAARRLPLAVAPTGPVVAPARRWAAGPWCSWCRARRWSSRRWWPRRPAARRQCWFRRPAQRRSWFRPPARRWWCWSQPPARRWWWWCWSQPPARRWWWFQRLARRWGPLRLARRRSPLVQIRPEQRPRPMGWPRTDSPRTGPARMPLPASGRRLGCAVRRLGIPDCPRPVSGAGSGGHQDPGVRYPVPARPHALCPMRQRRGRCHRRLAAPRR
jgi:hypothetical protein